MWVYTSVYLIFERSLELFQPLSTKTGFIVYRPGETYGDSGDLSHVIFSDSNQCTAVDRSCPQHWLVPPSLETFPPGLKHNGYCHTQVTLRFYILPKTNLKCGFCKKLLLYECNSDQLPTFFILSSLSGGFAIALLLHPPRSDDKMKKRATGQSCIRKEVTSYKIHTLS